MSIGKAFGLGLAALSLVVLLLFGGKIVENVNASEIVLVQSPGGTLSWHTTPGWICQCFGTVTSYTKRGTITFQYLNAETGDGRLPLQFYDNGRAKIRGSVNYELPVDAKHLTDLHQFYPDQASLESSLIAPALKKSVYLTGSLMTSFESFKEKRASLVQLVEDQTQNGVFAQRQVEKEVDEETLDDKGQPRIIKKRVTASEIKLDKDGKQERVETGQLAKFAVQVFNFAIEDIEYDGQVTEQMKQQQQLTMAVQTSIANAKKSVQDAVTAEAQGRANVAVAQATRAAEKATAVVAAEQARDVAKLDAEQAGFEKEAVLKRASGEAEASRMKVQANNALELRIDAYKYGVKELASALAAHRLTPDVVLGGSSTSSASTLEQVMQTILVTQAKQLGLDISPKQ